MGTSYEISICNSNPTSPIKIIRDAWGMKSVTLDGKKIDYAKDWKGTFERMDNSTAHTLKFEWYPLASELVNAGYTYRAKCEHYISGSTAVQKTETIDANKTSHTVTIPKGADPKVYSFDFHLNLDKNGSSIGIISNEHIVKLVVSESHVWTEISNTATCTAAGVKTERCTKCGETKTTNVAALGHIDNGYSYNGYYHYKRCDRCNQKFVADEEHKFDKTTINTDDTCSVCGFVNVCSHDQAMDFEHDEHFHWYECDHIQNGQSCPNNGVLEKESHYVDPDYSEDKTSVLYNCQKGYVCGGCGNYFGKTGNHSWVLSKSVPATCTEDGYDLYVCEYNGKKDQLGNTIVCNETTKVTLPATGHTPIVTQAAVAPTCTTVGYTQEVKCKDCGRGSGSQNRNPGYRS